MTRLINWLESIYIKIEKMPGKGLEYIATITYAVAHLLMAIVHEPWYDEAVAWQIARCATLSEILFEIPHYEGHPPLWHLILLPFAKLGAPYELSLTIVSLIFAGAAVGLIIWKSPFPRVIRVLLPFTYFFFYQYGVISRPYCVMMLAFVLLALSYQNRNEKPGRYVGVMILLCLCSAYGIVIAGGLALIWLYEIWNCKNVFHFVKDIFEDKRGRCLISLLVIAILLIIQIFPKSDTFATNYSVENSSNNKIICLLYMILALPADVTMTSLYSDYELLQTTKFSISELLMTCVVGSVLWALIILWGYQKKIIALIVVPYSMFALFSAIVYISPHHIGIGAMLILFYFWVGYYLERNRVIKIHISVKEKRLIKKLVIGIVSLSFGISIYWNISSCIQDVFEIYAAGREEAEFIKTHGLDNYNIMGGWEVIHDSDENVVGMDANMCYGADNIAPYFDKNILFNFNYGMDSVNYTTHKKLSYQESENAYKIWKKTIPDVLYMNPDISLVYEDLNKEDYVLVYSEVTSRFWKGEPSYSRSEIRIKRELLDETNLREVERAYPPGWEILGKYIE